LTIGGLMPLEAKGGVMRGGFGTLPTDWDLETKDKIVEKLNQKGLRVVDVEDLAIRV